MSKHSSRELTRRNAAFRRMVKANPPEMPASFSHKDYRRVLAYARVAFCTGWNSGINDVSKGGV